MSEAALNQKVAKMRRMWGGFASPREMEPWEALLDEIIDAAREAGRLYGQYAEIRHQQRLEERIAESRQEGGK